jgi:hypothetical protein
VIPLTQWRRAGAAAGSTKRHNATREPVLTWRVTWPTHAHSERFLNQYVEFYIRQYERIRELVDEHGAQLVRDLPEQDAHDNHRPPPGHAETDTHVRCAGGTATDDGQPKLELAYRLARQIADRSVDPTVHRLAHILKAALDAEQDKALLDLLSEPPRTVMS